jgi:hypothetical protein
MNAQTKLTLRLDRNLIRRAKSFAKKSGKSVSAIVADFFEVLDERHTGDQPDKGPRLTPTVRSLLGVMEDAALDAEDYRRYLERKHR